MESNNSKNTNKLSQLGMAILDAVAPLVLVYEMNIKVNKNNSNNSSKFQALLSPLNTNENN